MNLLSLPFNNYHLFNEAATVDKILKAIMAKMVCKPAIRPGPGEHHKPIRLFQNRVNYPKLPYY